MSYVTGSPISILINKGKIEPFKPIRGIRQENAISLYLFILYMKRFSRTVDHIVTSQLWHPIKITNRGPSLSHLFIADDLTLFSRATKAKYINILNIMNNFSLASGQKINHAKSKALFSKNYSVGTTHECFDTLHLKSNNTFRKYLGFPIFHKNLPMVTTSLSLTI